MENIMSVIISAVLSGALATLITLFWQARNERLRDKKEVFKTLMAYRFLIVHAENVKALNEIQVLFCKDEKVLSAWDAFTKEAYNKESKAEKVMDAYIKLLEEIGKACGYKNIQWTAIKQYYYPRGLEEEINENTLMRKANLQMVTGFNQQINNMQNVNTTIQ